MKKLLIVSTGQADMYKVLKNHLQVLEYLSYRDCFKIQQPDIPEKIKKPKHKPPFWANNWRNK